MNNYMITVLAAYVLLAMLWRFTAQIVQRKMEPEIPFLISLGSFLSALIVCGYVLWKGIV